MRDTDIENSGFVEAMKGFAALPRLIMTMDGMASRLDAMQSELASLKQNKPAIKKGFATVKEAAHYLNVSVKTVRRYIDRGIFKPSNACRKRMIPIEQLENFDKATR